jgi:hypothetical protein
VHHSLTGFDAKPAAIAGLDVAAGDDERDIGLAVAVAGHSLEGAMAGD